jgi:hypothetical protein
MGLERSLLGTGAKWVGTGGLEFRASRIIAVSFETICIVTAGAHSDA